MKDKIHSNANLIENFMCFRSDIENEKQKHFKKAKKEQGINVKIWCIVSENKWISHPVSNKT